MINKFIQNLDQRSKVPRIILSDTPWFLACAGNKLYIIISYGNVRLVNSHILCLSRQ